MKKVREFVARQFALTGEEVRLVSLILLVAVVGLCARCAYQQHRTPAPYAPPPVAGEAPTVEE